MGSAVIKTNTMATFSYVKEFMQSWDCPIVDKIISESRIDLYVDGSDIPTISYLSNNDIYIHGEEFNWVANSGIPTNTLLVVYSDTFFHYWHYGGGGSAGPGMYEPRINYFYEKIGDKKFEGYGKRNHTWLDFSCYDTIYNCTIYDLDTGAFYYHKNWMNYIGNDNTIDFVPDFLFEFDTASEFDSPDVFACTTVPRHQVIVIDGKEYFSIEEHLLIPLFDPEPEPEPNNSDIQDN